MSKTTRYVATSSAGINIKFKGFGPYHESSRRIKHVKGFLQKSSSSKNAQTQNGSLPEIRGEHGRPSTVLASTPIHLQDRGQLRHDQYPTQQRADRADGAGNVTGYLKPRHLAELRNSAIDDGILSLNFKLIAGDDALEHLLYALPDSDRRNDGRLRDGILKKYDHVLDGGWWCNGLDPLNDWNPMEWGCFKADKPRSGWDSEKKIQTKPIKYEHPPGTPPRTFFLQVTPQIAALVATKAGVPIPELSVSDDGAAIGFWEWVRTNNILTTLTEGAKKAASLLSQGYAAIGLPGINSAYRKTVDDNGQTHYRLIPELEEFLGLDGIYTCERAVNVCFDFETKPKTRRNVNIAISRIGTLIEGLSGGKVTVKVVQLPGPQKGVDDFIVKCGVKALDKLFTEALDLWLFRLIANTPSLTYEPDLVLNQRYLGKLPFPKHGMAFIKSPKGSGKTQSLESLVAEAMAIGRKVILITHRIQLGKQICNRLGLDWIDEKDQVSDGRWIGLCVDSVHKLNTEDYAEAIVICDEAEQVTWHWLGGNTCKDRRTLTLTKISQLMRTVISTHGLVVGLDADLSDCTVNYFTAMTGNQVKPWICVNEWKSEEMAKLYLYNHSNPCQLILKIEELLADGKKVYICVDSRDGRYSAKGLLDHLTKSFPELKILCVDAQTSRTPGHPAVGFVENINESITDWDVVIATPSIGSGVSIDVREYFNAVFGIFKGVVPDWEARQALARVREPVDRHVWAAKQGIGWVRGTARLTNPKEIFRVLNQTSKFGMIRAGLIAGSEEDLLEGKFDVCHMKAWAEVAARINASMWQYRQAIHAGLVGEGFQVEVIAEPEQPSAEEVERADRARQLSRKMKQSARARKDEYYQTIESAPALTEDQYQRSKDKRQKTDAEEAAETKYVLTQMYAVQITAAIAEKSDKGYHTKIQRHFFATHDIEFAKLRDRKQALNQLDIGEQLYLPDLRHFTLEVELLKSLGVLEWANPERQTFCKDPRLIADCSRWLNYSNVIKETLKIDIRGHKPAVEGGEIDDPVGLLNRLLDFVGLGYKSGKRIQLGKTRYRIYCFDIDLLNDERQEIFPGWLEKWTENYREYQEELDRQNRTSSSSTGSLEVCPTDSIRSTTSKVVDANPVDAGHWEEVEVFDGFSGWRRGFYRSPSGRWKTPSGRQPIAKLQWRRIESEVAA